MNRAAAIQVIAYLLGAVSFAFCSTQNRYKLPKVYEQWLDEDVRWIITPGERAEFRKLSSNDERDRFIEWFWKRRDPTPDAPNTNFCRSKCPSLPPLCRA